MQFSIYRYHPKQDKKPRMQDYTLDTERYKPAMVLDALRYLKEQDESLAFRRSCGEGVCGSDGMSINGHNRLACITPLASLKDPIVLRPLPGMPVIRDLIVDLTQFFAQYNKTKPYLQNTEAPPEKERLQSPAERSKLNGLYECILCGCCSSSCPSYWWNPDKFLGPAALIQAKRFIVDSRDNATSERLEQLGDAYSIFRCRSVMSCVQSCPKALNPNQAIGDIREQIIKK